MKYIRWNIPQGWFYSNYYWFFYILIYRYIHIYIYIHNIYIYIIYIYIIFIYIYIYIYIYVSPEEIFPLPPSPLPPSPPKKLRKGCLKALRAPNALSRAAEYAGATKKKWGAGEAEDEVDSGRSHH